MTEEEKPEIEINEEQIASDSTTVIITDSEDYSKTQKLKSIQEAKKHYKSFTYKRDQKYKKIKEHWSNPTEAIEMREAEAITIYASELLPLVEQAVEKGSLSEDDLIIEANATLRRWIDREELDLKTIIETRGQIPVNGSSEALPKSYQLKIYRHLEDIERKLGLGPTLEEQKGPAEI